MEQKRGYQIVDVGLALLEQDLTFDQQVQILSHLIRRIREVAPVLTGVLFEVIPLSCPGFGPYPAIGVYTVTFVNTNFELVRVAEVVQACLQAVVAEAGAASLLERSAAETLRWADVLRAFGQA